jgi:hypothetical protein
MGNAYTILVGKPFGRPRHRWNGNTEINLKGKRFEGVDWIQLAQSRVQWRFIVNIVKNIWVS